MKKKWYELIKVGDILKHKGNGFTSTIEIIENNSDRYMYKFKVQVLKTQSENMCIDPIGRISELCIMR